MTDNDGPRRFLDGSAWQGRRPRATLAAVADRRTSAMQRRTESEEDPGDG